jgi:hypothetical protein
MAKRSDTPALTAERVWNALRVGSLKAETIPGTRMLRVLEGRLHLTWKKGNKKKRARIRLNKVYLNPRWISLPKDYPIPVRELKQLDNDELNSLGIIPVGRNEFKLLIFQQVGDLYSLRRQLSEHIQEQYERESAMLWKLLEKSSARGPLKIWEQKALTGVVLERMEKIDTISTHLAGRLEAVESLIKRLSKLQQHIKGALITLKDYIPKRIDTSAAGTVRGLRNSLKLHYKSLGYLLEDRPFFQRAYWARHHLEKASNSLKEGRFDKARHHFEKAIAHLENELEGD